MPQQQTIAVIGLGLLGSGIAERLSAAGFDVVGHDIDSSREAVMTELGGRWAGSIAEAAGVSRIVLSLPDADVSKTVCEEMSPYLQAGTVVLDTTTGDPETMAAIGDRLAGRNVSYLDACIGGSSAQCRAGEVIAMVGGDREAFEECRPILGAFARRCFHLGPCGSGARMKLVLNLVLGLNRAVLAEGLSLAEAFGLESDATLDVLRSGPAYSTVMDTKGRKMIDGDFIPQARLRQHRKDVELIVKSAEQSNAALPFSVLHGELLDQLIAAGYGEEDNAAIIRAFSNKPEARARE